MVFELDYVWTEIVRREIKMARSMKCCAQTALVVVMTLLAGCGALSGGKRSSQFDLQMLGFENAIRWGKFKSADTYRRREPGQMPGDYPEYKDVKVTAYELRGEVPADNGDRITRVVNIDYYWSSNPAVRTIEHTQVWVYDAQAELWFLESELPRFK